MTDESRTRLLPLLAIAFLILIWQIGIATHPDSLLPGPLKVLRAILELIERNLLLKYVVASLFRVTWGYLGAVALAVPLGILIGLSSRWEAALNPLLQVLRPISPLAWIPVAILWFGVGDGSAIFLIFLASSLPLLVTSIQAVHNVDSVYLRAGSNFGLGRRQLLQSIVVPAVMPELIVGLRITLGVSWLVVVAAEMIAVNSGLGFLIVDARNAGNRYDLVVAGMLMIGVIGFFLDYLMRRLERLKSVRWGYAAQ